MISVVQEKSEQRLGAKQLDQKIQSLRERSETAVSIADHIDIINSTLQTLSVACQQFLQPTSGLKNIACKIAPRFNHDTHRIPQYYLENVENIKIISDDLCRDYTNPKSLSYKCNIAYADQWESFTADVIAQNELSRALIKLSFRMQNYDDVTRYFRHVSLGICHISNFEDEVYSDALKAPRTSFETLKKLFAIRSLVIIADTSIDKVIDLHNMQMDDSVSRHVQQSDPLTVEEGIQKIKYSRDKLENIYNSTFPPLYNLNSTSNIDAAYHRNVFLLLQDLLEQSYDGCVQYIESTVYWSKFNTEYLQSGTNSKGCWRDYYYTIQSQELRRVYLCIDSLTVLKNCYFDVIKRELSDSQGGTTTEDRVREQMLDVFEQTFEYLTSILAEMSHKMFQQLTSTHN
jgi:hypothetical protein